MYLLFFYISYCMLIKCSIPVANKLMSKGYISSIALLEPATYGESSNTKTYEIVLSLIQKTSVSILNAISLSNILIGVILSGVLYNSCVKLLLEKMKNIKEPLLFNMILLIIQLLRVMCIFYIINDIFKPLRSESTEIKEGPFDVSMLFKFYKDYKNTFYLKDYKLLDSIISDFLFQFPECNFILKLHDYSLLIFIYLIGYFAHLYVKLPYSNISALMFVQDAFDDFHDQFHEDSKLFSKFMIQPVEKFISITQQEKDHWIKTFDRYAKIVLSTDDVFYKNMCVFQRFSDNRDVISLKSYILLCLIPIIGILIFIFHENILQILESEIQEKEAEYEIITGGEIYSSAQISTFAQNNGLSAVGHEYVFEDLCEKQNTAYNSSIDRFVSDNLWITYVGNIVFYAAIIVWMFYLLSISIMVGLQYLGALNNLENISKLSRVNLMSIEWMEYTQNLTFVEYLYKHKNDLMGESRTNKDAIKFIDYVLRFEKEINSEFLETVKNDDNKSITNRAIYNNNMSNFMNCMKCLKHLIDLQVRLDEYQTSRDMIKVEIQSLITSIHAKQAEILKDLDKLGNISTEVEGKKNSMLKRIGEVDEIWSDTFENKPIPNVVQKVLNAEAGELKAQKLGNYFDEIEKNIASVHDEYNKYILYMSAQDDVQKDLDSFSKSNPEITKVIKFQTALKKICTLIYDSVVNDMNNVCDEIDKLSGLMKKRYKFAIFLIAFIFGVVVQVLETQHITKAILHVSIIFLSIALYSNNDDLSRYTLQGLFVISVICIILLYVEYYGKFDDFVEDMDKRIVDLRAQSIQLHVENANSYGELKEVRYDIGSIGFEDRILINDISLEFDMMNTIFKFKSNGRYLVPSNIAKNQMDKDVLELFATGKVQWSDQFNSKVVSLLSNTYSLTEIRSSYDRIQKILHCNKYILTGTSGSGKTTLIEIITMKLQRYLCDIKYLMELNGKVNMNMYEELPFIQKDWIQYMPQAPIKTTFIPLRLRDLVKLSGKTEKEIDDLLKLLDLPVDMNEKLSYQSSFLSGGEMARLAFVMNWMMRGNKKLLVIDEFDASIDRNNVNKIINLVWKIEEAILLISHHLDNFKNVNYIQVKLENQSISLIYHEALE
jgi:ABC-type dipeptide/oligopeptide/nickel transport system ATPase subunit